MKRKRLFVVTALLIFENLSTVCLAQAPTQCSGETSTWSECSGSQELKDGSTYVGEFRNGLFDGKGTLTWKDGDQYIGDFKIGIREGMGTVTLSKVAKISGRWVDGRYAGP